MFPAPQKLHQLQCELKDIWWLTITDMRRLTSIYQDWTQKSRFFLWSTDQWLHNKPHQLLHSLLSLLCHYVVKKPLIFRLTQTQWVYRPKFHTLFGWKLITACYFSCFPVSRRKWKIITCIDFTISCFVLWTATTKNINNKKKIFLCFRSIKDCKIVIK